MRLQDVSLSYSFSPKFLEKIKAQAINVYVSGKNLAIWTNWEGWDPEALVPVFINGQTVNVPNGLIIDGRPALRAFTFGVHIRRNF